MLVHVAIRQHQDYPYAPVCEGVCAAGDSVAADSLVAADRAMITWNKYGVNGKVGEQVKEAGGIHVVMENGYLRRDRRYFLMNKDGFNGLEHTDEKDYSPERFEKLRASIQPWKHENGEHILVCGQRGGNYSPLAMPNEWPAEIIKQLKQLTDRPILYRRHPARERSAQVSNLPCFRVSSEQPLSVHLKNAFAVVVWTSNAATEALLAGVPVFYCGPIIAMREAALKGIRYINTPYYGDREQLFWNLAWRQWNVDEIRSGIAWKHVAHCA